MREEVEAAIMRAGRQIATLQKQNTDLRKELNELKRRLEPMRTKFNPDDESTYPPPFRWVKTDIGIGFHAFLKDMPDETYDKWNFIFDNKDIVTLSTGFGTDYPDLMVEWWEPIYDEDNFFCQDNFKDFLNKLDWE